MSDLEKWAVANNSDDKGLAFLLAFAKCIGTAIENPHVAKAIKGNIEARQKLAAIKQRAGAA